MDDFHTAANDRRELHVLTRLAFPWQRAMLKMAMDEGLSTEKIALMEFAARLGLAAKLYVCGMRASEADPRAATVLPSEVLRCAECLCNCQAADILVAFGGAGR
jgi:hypothetical protein